MIPIVLALALLADPHPPHPAPAPAPFCALTQESKAKNRTLDFQNFDQLPSFAFNARALAQAGCYREAAEATEDYLAYGPVQTPGRRAILAFHMAQYLASAGDERSAARLVPLARRDDLPPDNYIDWNTFVDGMRAFFVKDRPGLDRAIATLRARGKEGDDMNAKALESLARCFDRPYNEAWTTKACEAPKP